MFLVSFLILLFAAWWVPFRFCRLLKLKTKHGLWASAGILPLLFASVAGFLIPAKLESTGPLTWLANAGGLFFMFYVYCFFLMLLEQAFHFLLKKLQRDAWCATVPAILAALLVLGGWLHARNFQIRTLEIPVAGLQKPVMVLHISDLHLGPQRGKAWLRRMVDAVNAQNPDFVLYNGDLADSNCALHDDLFALFRDVRVPQLYTIGNHEYYIDTPRVLKLIEKNGIRILRNKAVEIAGIEVTGLEYMSEKSIKKDPHRVNNLTVEEEVPKIVRKGKLPQILFHHTPRGADFIARSGFDVMISGHTHDGQVFPGMLFTRLMFPYECGFYRIGNMTLFVSQGAGTFGPWMRLGTSNEIQLIRFVPAR